MEHIHDEHTGAKISTRAYITGFILALALTILSFSMVFLKHTSRHWIMAGILIAAVAQMLVHLHYFLHLDRSSAARWNVIALVFTAILLFIFIGGTMWVMFTLNTRMM